MKILVILGVLLTTSVSANPQDDPEEFASVSRSVKCAIAQIIRDLKRGGGFTDPLGIRSRKELLACVKEQGQSVNDPEEFALVSRSVKCAIAQVLRDLKRGGAFTDPLGIRSRKELFACVKGEISDVELSLIYDRLLEELEAGEFED